MRRHRILHAKFADRRTLECRHDGSRAQRGGQIAAERADVRAAAAFDFELQLRILVARDLQTMDRDGARGEFRCSSSACQFVGSVTGDFDRRVERRPLLDVAQELRQRALDLCARWLR